MENEILYISSKLMKITNAVLDLLLSRPNKEGGHKEIRQAETNTMCGDLLLR